MQQKELNLMGEAQGEPTHILDDLAIKNIKDGSMALRLTISTNAMSQEDLADVVGTNKRSISRALKGSCGLPVDVLIKICKESNNVALAQYICHQLGGTFVFKSKEDIEYEIAEKKFLEAKAAREIRRVA